MIDKVNIKKFLQAEPNLAAFVTLFSFGTLARGTQFLVPFIIYSCLPSSKKVDLYFYWSTQSNLVATFLASIWPTALMSLIVKERAQNGESSGSDLAAMMLTRFFVFAALIASITAILACNNLLGGPQFENSKILLGLFLTISCSSISLALSEVATAYRRFGLAYQSLIISSVVQLLILAIFQSEDILLISFLIGCITQLAVSIFLLRSKLKLFFSSIKTALLPSKNTVFLLYTGSLFTMLSSHVCYRILGNDQVGAVAAFAMASMLAQAPQQLFIQHLSTIAAVTMTESFQHSPHDFERISNNWRNRLFRASLLLGLIFAICSWIAFAVLPYFNWVKDSWILVVSIMIFLSMPLAISGLTTWLARLTTTVEKIEHGACYQIIINTITIAVLLACSGFELPYSAPMALAIAAIIQLISIPIYQRFILGVDSRTDS